MAEYTNHYNLKKPLKTESYDVDVANTNNDIIDEKLYGKVDKFPGKDLSSNDFTDGYKQKVDKLIEGTKGDSAYQIAVNNGFEGTEKEWLATLKGEKGDTGEVSKEELNKITENKRIKLEGKSEQETSTQGKNYFTGNKITSESNLGITYNFDNSILKLNGTVTEDGSIILDKSTKVKLPAGTYTYFIRVKTGTYERPSGDFALYIMSASNTFITGNYATSGITGSDLKNGSGASSRVITITEEKEIFVRFFASNKDIKFNNLELEIQIEKGNSFTGFKQFVPNSPSPEYPSRIRNVEDNINSFDKDNAKLLNAYFDSTTGAIINGGNSTITTTYTKIVANQNFVLTCKKLGKVVFYDDDKNIIKITTTSSPFVFNENASYIRIQYETAGSDINSIKLKKGSIAMPYTPYGCGSIDYLIEDMSNNVFNKDTDIELDGQYRDWHNGSINANQYFYGIKIKVESNSIYEVYSNGNYSNLCYFNNNMTYLSGETFGKNAKRQVFTTPENCKYITLAIEKTSLQSFAMYRAQGIHFLSSEGQLLHKDDYIVDNKIHQKRKTLVLTGNETITRRGYVDSTNKTYRYSIELEGRDVNSRTNLICSHLPTDGNYWNNKSLIFGGGSNEGNIVYLQFVLDEIEMTDVTKINEYFKTQYENGTPVIIEYKLAEEIVTPLTKEQIEAHYELQKAKYVDNMPLTCLNEIEPTLIDTDKKLEESLLDVEKLLAILSLNS